MIAPTLMPVTPVFSSRLREAVDVIHELKRRGLSEQAAANVMICLAIDRLSDELDHTVGEVVAELEAIRAREDSQ